MDHTLRFLKNKLEEPIKIKTDAARLVKGLSIRNKTHH